MASLPLLSQIDANFIKDLAAGGMAGAVSRTAVSPLERLKILFQVQASQPGAGRGILGTLRHIGATEGWRGYLKGNGTNIIRIVPYSAVQFASYESYKRLLLTRSGQEDLDTAQRLLAGAMAGITSVTVTYPLDIIRTRLSLVGADVAGGGSRILAVGRRIVTEEGGPFALYRGLLPTVLGIAPYVALNFTTYETLKRALGERVGRSLDVTERLACGGTAGAVAQTLTYPLDVLRRRLQVHAAPGSPYRYAGLGAAVLAMARTEGLRGFYKGMLPNLLKVVPAMSISFVTYEATKKALNKIF